MDEVKRDLQVSLGGMINARLGELESRLPPEPVLRPPLAADRNQEPPARPRAQPNLAAGAMREPQPQPKKASAGAKSGQQPKKAPTDPDLQPQPRKKATGPAKKGTKRGPNSGPEAGPQSQSQPVAGPSWRGEPAPENDGAAPWSRVLGRKRRKQNVPTQPSKTPPPRANAPSQRTKPVKIVAPRTAAIVVSLKEGATNILEVLAKAKSAISLADFGLESVKVRATMTGSRMMEVGGERPENAADLLAARLREVIGDQADISRPTKLADLKVSGLDEMVGREELASAMARVGDAPPT